MRPVTKARLQIHFAVFLWGFSSILGKAITLGASELTWWRMLLCVAALAMSPRVWRATARMERTTLVANGALGALLVLHWMAFYGAIKLANASVSATCLALAPAFVALIDPFIARRRFDVREGVLAIAVAPGMAMVVGGIPGAMRLGLAVGVLSALLLALYVPLAKRVMAGEDAFAVSAVQFGAGLAILTPLELVSQHRGFAAVPSAHDGALLIILAGGCSLLPMGAYVASLKHLPAFAVSLTTTLEPVYSIVLAAIFFGEQRQVTPVFYMGAIVIAGAVLAQPLLTEFR